MSKSKKKKKNPRVSAEEKAVIRQEKAEMRSRQNRRALILLACIVIIIVLLVAMLAGTFNTGRRYTAEKYAQIESGMSYYQITDIMGTDGESLSGNETSSNGEGIETYTWSNRDGSHITITFVDDQVAGFSQNGILDEDAA